MSGHFCNQRIEEIGKDDSDRYWDQDRLKESDHIGRDPDHRASDRNEHHDEECSERSPHRLALPGCGMFYHSIKQQHQSPQRLGLASVPSQSIRLIFAGGPLLIVVLVFSILSASKLFPGSKAIAF